MIANHLQGKRTIWEDVEKSEADEFLHLQIVDKTIMEADQDRDGKISFEEFTKMVENTDVSMSMTLGKASYPHPSASFVPNIGIRPRDSSSLGLR